MPLVLSTKVLPPKLKRHFFSANIGLVEYNAVILAPIENSFGRKNFNNAIFTSQNAVKIAIETHKLTFHNVVCVGKKTASLLLNFGFKPKIIAKDAKDLAHRIIEKYPDQSFSFFCSALRRDELPCLLKRNNIKLVEYHLYHSVINNKHFTNNFDAVLCFSPLGVKSYFDNHDKQPKAICIGETTASSAMKYTNQVLTSSRTTLESVVVKAIKSFN
jgi:uroporphyrinogen-III synthase